jgi:hypothetical protein
MTVLQTFGQEIQVSLKADKLTDILHEELSTLKLLWLLATLCMLSTVIYSNSKQ